MYLQARLKSHSITLFSLLFLLAGCHTILSTSDDEREPRRDREQPTRISPKDYQPEALKVPPADIKSVQLYAEDDRKSAPILDLEESDSYLTLRFDQLSSRNRLFRVRISHYNADWKKSNLTQSTYLSGFRQTEITDSRVSSVQNPAYTHYVYRLPEDFSIDVSGNYLLEVYSYEDDELLFSLPFFATEDRGDISTSVEQLFAGAGAHRLSHQLFTNFRYPDFIQMPDEDLSFYFVQNQFWGKATKATERDMTDPGSIRSHIRRENSFPGRYEFRELDLRELRADGRRIIDYRPEMIPPRLYLFRDIVDLNVEPYNRTSNRFGQIIDDRDARYAEVRFELEVPEDLQNEDPIYLIGPFNNWKINEANRMRYDSDSGTYRGSAVLKQGVYDYKYVVKTEEGVDELRLDASFFDGIQEYHTFAYYHDRRLGADRLINYDRKTIRSR